METSPWQIQVNAKREFAKIASYLAFRANGDLVRSSTDWRLFGFLALLNRRLGALDLDVSLKISAVLDADSRRRNIANHLAIPLDLDAIARAEIAGGIAVDDHFARGNFRIQIGRAPYGQPVASKRNVPLDLAINLQVFVARDFTFHHNG